MYSKHKGIGLMNTSKITVIANYSLRLSLLGLCMVIIAFSFISSGRWADIIITIMMLVSLFGSVALGAIALIAGYRSAEQSKTTSAIIAIAISLILLLLLFYTHSK